MTDARVIHGRCGFTLIELLVVISFVALLIGLLLHVLKKAKESARRAICLSNLSPARLRKRISMVALPPSIWRPTPVSGLN